ncbi:MAG: hypothetical protein ABSA97_12395, partial [Verrucomicrobiia bacterium]
FNIARPNRNKEWKTPLQILRERNPKLDPAIASWRPLDLGAELSQYFHRYLPKRGHNLPVHPSFLPARPATTSPMWAGAAAGG